VVFKGQNHRVVGSLESSLCNGLNHLLCRDLRYKSVAVHNHGLFGAAIPKVELYASAACQQALPVDLDRRFSSQLVAREVCIVRRVDKVVRQGLVHVVQLIRLGSRNNGVVFTQQIPQKAVKAEHTFKVNLEVKNVLYSQDGI